MHVRSFLVSGLGVVLAAQTAYAQDGDYELYERPSKYGYAWNDPALVTGLGVGFHIGAGFGGFTGQTMSDIVMSNVTWLARVTVGTHIPIGLDFSYVGTAADVMPFGSDSGTLIGTAVEATLRWNILPHFEWNPYVFGGVGWQRYDLADATVSRAITGMEGEDNLFDVPMGLGIAYRDPSGIVFDMRGTFRLAQESTLLRNATGNNAGLDSWEASGALGYEF